MDVNLEWKGGLKFSGISLFGHAISTDGSKSAGGNEDGYKPTELLWYSLAGCTGIDVVLIANKMHQEISGLQIKVSAEQREDFPKAFTKAQITYVFTGKNLDRAKLEQAIELSETKYCSVGGATISGITRLTHTCEIIEG